jgi:hypothetical protein
VLRWGLRDGRSVQEWDPRLRLLELLQLGTGYERIPSRAYRTVYRLGDRLPLWRHMMGSSGSASADDRAGRFPNGQATGHRWRRS